MIEDRVLDRLRAQCASEFALIEGALSLAMVKDGRPPATPALYVVPLDEESDDNQRIGSLLQQTQIDIGVVIIVGNVSDTTGDAARRDLAPVKKSVRDALLGFVPDGAEEPLTHVSGRLTNAKGGTVWWEEVFATSYFMEAQL